MKKALILTYYWPPGSGPGVQRWLKFCKFLPENEWQPTVITVANGSYPSEDASLLDDVPETLKVIRTKTLEPFALYNALRGKKGKSVEVAMGSIKGKTSLFSRFSNYVRANYFVPDARVGWNHYAYPAAIQAIDRDRPDVIITSGPPHSTHLIGERLQSMYGIPWVADFRDPWTSIYYNAMLNRTNKTIARDQKLETRVVSTAAGVVCASPGIEDELSDRARHITTIHNGFDSEDFPTESPPAEANVFTIAYIGNLKANQNVPTLWETLTELSSREVFKDKIKLQITGNVNAEIISAIEAAGAKPITEILPFVPHAEAVKRMLSAHLLLLPIPKSEGNKAILTGKIFEYLATQRPILGIGPVKGNAAQIFEECGKAPMMEYEDATRMRETLEEHLNHFLSKPLPQKTGNDGYKKYSRQGLTEKLASTLNQWIEKD